MIKIIPSILTDDPSELREMIEITERVCRRISIDIIDGVFAQNKTVDPTVFKGIDTYLKLDFQLMVKNPIKWVEKCANAGADRIIGHVEMMKDQRTFVGKVQEIGLSPGLALDLETSIEKIEPDLIDSLDVILLMSVKAGFGGQDFQEKVLSKLSKLAKIKSKENVSFKIHVDGGVNFDNIKDIKVSGADEVSVGRALFKGDLIGNIDRLTRKAGV